MPEHPSPRAVPDVAPPGRAELVEQAVQTWRAALAQAAGTADRGEADLHPEVTLDLSAAHPSGMAQLFAGRPTRLSNLVREPAALSSARRRARSVCARAAVSVQRYGVGATSLAIGVATWLEHDEPAQPDDDLGVLAEALGDAQDTTPQGEPRRMRVPVLLRPVTVRARGSAESDYELSLEPTAELNPVLARALRARGALLDADALARGTFGDGTFDPRAALARLDALGRAVLTDFELVDQRVVGTFVHPGQQLVDDLDALAGALAEHEVVAALAGDEAARAQLRRELPEPVPGDRDPAEDRGVGDLDPAQRHVLDAVASGAHVFVDAPAGADVAGTLAAVVADAAAAGRTVLYVPGHRRGATALAGRLQELGLGELVLDVPADAGWRSAAMRRMLGAMTLEAPAVDEEARARSRAQLLDLRSRLAGYVTALHRPREPWGACAYDALQQLARLTASRPCPRTTVRLDPQVARLLDESTREARGADLTRAAELGAFTLGPGHTPWFGADLRTAGDAQVALRRVERLLDAALPVLTERIAAVGEQTGLTAPTSLTDWAQQLSVLADVRDCLDVFLPIVFERTAADLVAATATKPWREQHGVTMGFWLRRRLRRQARDMVRPGRPVADLHAALVQVQQRRDRWQALCPAGGWPRLPDGLELVEAEYREIRADVEALDQVLAGAPAVAGSLATMPLAGLVALLERLRHGADALTDLPERTAALLRVTGAGLGALVDDLRERAVPASLAAAELDLAWWSTVFEQIVAADPDLAGYDGEVLDDLARRFVAADREQIETMTAPVLAATVGGIQRTLREHRDQAEQLFVELVEESVPSPREAITRYPEVAPRLRPVLTASPMLVPQVLPPGRGVDLVVLDAVGHLTTAVAVAAIARGRQVVVVGDARCASGSAVRELAAALPGVALHADSSRRDPHLTAFLADHGYAGVLVPTPLPGTEPLVSLVLADGTGMPVAGSSLVDSTRDEVAAVVELVLDHALSRTHESLAVVTLTPRHADAVRDAVLSEVRGNPALAAFFDSARPEPFVVVDLAGVAGLRREAVVLSLGLGRTPHRRVLHSFGPLGEDRGAALLLDALGSTRHRLTVVSCFDADDLDPERLRGAGPQLLRDLLKFARERGTGTLAMPDEPPSAGPDRLVLDLAERLWRHGLSVELDHGLPGGVRIPLVVGHPDLPDRMLVAVLTDDEAYVAEPSVRVRDRLVADRLTALGWTVVRVWSAAAFLDPQAEVDRIRRAVHAALPDELRMPSTRAVPVVPLPTVVPDDADDEPLPSLTPEPSSGPTPSDDERAEPVGSPESTPQSRPEPTPELTPGPTPEPRPRQLALAVPARPRPDVRQGLPIGAYSDDQLDDLIEWIRSDGQERTREQLADALRSALGITRRSHRVDSAVRGAVTRALS